jgi:hypothetical protein
MTSSDFFVQKRGKLMESSSTLLVAMLRNLYFRSNVPLFRIFGEFALIPLLGEESRHSDHVYICRRTFL